MTTIRCDECGEILDKKKQSYYEIGNIEFHSHKKSYVYKYIQTHVDKKTTTDRSESWVDYPDLHFCVGCIKDVRIATLIGGGLK